MEIPHPLLNTTAHARPFLAPAGCLPSAAALPRPWKGLVMLVAALTLAACETGTRLDTPSTLAPVETRNPVAAPPTASTTGAASTGSPTASSTPTAPQSQVATVDLAAAGTAAAAAARQLANSQRVVYFDFDSFAIRDDFKPMLEAHAKVLAAAGARRVVVEGHTDERGGSEYNLALGQKRAEAVVRSLALLGAPEAKLEAVSFGKERPAVQGSDETAWARNRRAELKDR
jgi:peptidoglycan-associated lipoprotein